MTHEVEWDDAERDKMLALAEHEAGVCECGMHASLADEDPDLEMIERTCPVCAGIARNLRIYAERDRQATDDKAPPEILRPGDGRHLALRTKPVVAIGASVPLNH